MASFRNSSARNRFGLGSNIYNRQNGVERQLFLDISELAQRDAATGVEGGRRGLLAARDVVPGHRWRRCCHSSRRPEIVHQ